MSHLDEDTGVLLPQEHHLEYNNIQSGSVYRQVLPLAVELGENCASDMR